MNRNCPQDGEMTLARFIEIMHTVFPGKTSVIAGNGANDRRVYAVVNLLKRIGVGVDGLNHRLAVECDDEEFGVK